MSIREIVAASNIPYRNVVFGVLTTCAIGVYVPFWLPSSWYFLYYIIIIVGLLGLLYLTFWVYKSGFKKQALLMGVLYVTLFTIFFVIAIWLQDSRSV